MNKFVETSKTETRYVTFDPNRMLGKHIKADTWYKLINGEFVEA